MEHIKQQLSRLKAIEPNKEFSRRSLSLILNIPQKEQLNIFQQVSQILKSKAVFAISAASIFLILGGLALLNNNILKKSSLLTNLDPQKLDNEIKQFDIQIQLSQAEYYENSAKEIELALKKTSDETNKE